MKLWLQVIFAQGYLLRSLFPDDFRDEDIDRTDVNWAALVIGLLVTSVGAIASVRGDVILGVALVVTGAASVLWYGDSLGLKTVFHSRAFWISVSWAAGTITVVGIFVLLASSAIWGVWLILLSSACFVLFFGTMGLRTIERRYLYFAQRDSVWDSDAIASLPDIYLDAYWRLPREILRTMLHRPRAAT